MTDQLAQAMIEMQEASYKHDDEAYEVAFKKVAQLTQGSLLFNEDPTDYIVDDYGFDEATVNCMKKLREKQRTWLREIGLDWCAELWGTAE